MSATDLFAQQETISLGNSVAGGRVLKFGDIIGGTYSLRNLIGRGGMGCVFRVRHTILERDYALKILAPEQLNEVSWKRFESEGRAIAGLNHPNIVKVFDMAIDEGDCPFYVMELLTGNSLAEEFVADKGMELAQTALRRRTTPHLAARTYRS